MDAITQGVLGAAAAQAALSDRLGRRVWLYGALGGWAPDLDVFIRSSIDPTVAIEYHRNFTHALAFIPVGGLLVALPWILRKERFPEWRTIALATTVGYATHGLLDAFTSYGTMLLWPFSDVRVAWSWISIVDLGYTLPLIVGVILAARRSSPRPARIALLVSSVYMALCGLQRARVIAAQGDVQGYRGHHAARGDAFPTLANNVTWRSLYAADGVIYADKIRVPLFVAQGANDPRVRKEESDQIVQALESRGVPVSYLVKENEGHGFMNEENQFEFYHAMESFLAEHLK